MLRRRVKIFFMRGLSARDRHGKPRLWLEPLHHARKRHRLAHMMSPANPCDHPLDTHAEAGVRHRSVAAQIEVPIERLERQFVLDDALLAGFRNRPRAGRRR